MAQKLSKHQGASRGANHASPCLSNELQHVAIGGDVCESPHSRPYVRMWSMSEMVARTAHKVVARQACCLDALCGAWGKCSTPRGCISPAFGLALMSFGIAASTRHTATMFIL
eukprot:697702-Amphidinium_carterae.1